jgi:hypothetical protein
MVIPPALRAAEHRNEFRKGQSILVIGRRSAYAEYDGGSKNQV